VATSAPRSGVRRHTPLATPTIVLSSGEPAGIGPDICLTLANRTRSARLAVLGDPELLAARARQITMPVRLVERASAADIGPHRQGTLQVLPIALRAPVESGRLDPSNAEYVLEMLRRGVELCNGGGADALVTAPVQKSVIVDSGVPFTGHTEFLAELTGAAQPVMMLVSKTLRVALATTHLPLRRVADALDAAKLERLIEIVHGELRSRFGIETPRVLVLGLNPHAGESGTLGDEEQRIITPVVQRLRNRGIEITGPASADTAFTEDALGAHDVVIAMYHDQGLPALKALAFGEVVNVTLGLPIIRTSVDHGTALALAGSGRARPGSLYEALELAITLARKSRARA
jgi:4-hydroxythreonine-4-phosphate dehydrogenase